MSSTHWRSFRLRRERTRTVCRPFSQTFAAFTGPNSTRYSARPPANEMIDGVENPPAARERADIQDRYPCPNRTLVVLDRTPLRWVVIISARAWAFNLLAIKAVATSARHESLLLVGSESFWHRAAEICFLRPQWLLAAILPAVRKRTLVCGFARPDVLTKEFRTSPGLAAHLQTIKRSSTQCCWTSSSAAWRTGRLPAASGG